MLRYGHYFMYKVSAGLSDKEIFEQREPKYLT